MKKQKITICMVIFSFNAVVSAATFYWDDGLSHTVNDGIYLNDIIYLDYYTTNTPGTHIDLLDGGSVSALRAYNNSSITMTGGEVGGGIGAYDNTNVRISGGELGSNDSIIFSTLHASCNATVDILGGFAGDILDVRDNATVTLRGGEVGNIWVQDNSTVTMSGGAVVDAIKTYVNGTVYLNGTNFQVTDLDGNTVNLSNGDKLSDFGTLVELRLVPDSINDYYTGTITGILENGTALNNIFQIYNIGDNDGTADIIVVPEPATLLLIALGAMIMSKRRQ